ncbi:MAG: ATP-binding cassette domain-containing protein [Lachnospiraceae bacterium]|nr:ATP-binding cassette domain-containing protein [Lachnospiraceae bacterium]
MNANVIETNGLTKGTGSQMRVNHIDLRIPEGCVYGFLGPNGAGKTTTLKLLLGLLKPTAGDVIFFGQQMTDKNRLSILRHTGSLIESPSFYGHLTGLENLQIAAKLKKAPASEIAKVLQTVRLYEQKDKKVKQYSLGMKQRLGIAMALLGNPRVLILDEPTNGLDPAGIQEIREFIKNLPVTHQMTVIVSSHLLSEIELMADMVGIINHGELIFQGTMAALEAQGDGLEDIFLKLTGGSESL